MNFVNDHYLCMLQINKYTTMFHWEFIYDYVPAHVRRRDRLVSFKEWTRAPVALRGASSRESYPYG